MGSKTKACWGGSSGGGIDSMYWETRLIFSNQDSEFHNTQLGSSTQLLIQPPTLWIKAWIMPDSAIINTMADLHDDRQENNAENPIELSFWAFDDNDGSLPDSKPFQAGIWLYGDEDSITQNMTWTTSVSRTFDANNKCYNYRFLLPGQGNVSAGARSAMIVIRKENDTASGDPIIFAGKLRYRINL